MGPASAQVQPQWNRGGRGSIVSSEINNKIHNTAIKNTGSKRLSKQAQQRQQWQLQQQCPLKQQLPLQQQWPLQAAAVTAAMAVATAAAVTAVMAVTGSSRCHVAVASRVVRQACRGRKRGRVYTVRALGTHLTACTTWKPWASKIRVACWLIFSISSTLMSPAAPAMPL